MGFHGCFLVLKNINQDLQLCILNQTLIALYSINIFLTIDSSYVMREENCTLYKPITDE